MPICIGIAKEHLLDERRVALVPDTASRLTQLGIKVLLESDAGAAAYFADEMYQDVEIIQEARTLYQQADIVLKVQPPTLTDIEAMRKGSIIVSFMSPHQHLDRVIKMQEQQVTALAMELIPRISRAQTMDALSSQANIAGYKAVLMAADLSKIFFPMLTTAAGTIRPAKVLVIGAGVAGLQAIATAKRLGAMVEAYDVRAATKEQVESLGAKFVEIAVKAEGSGGYARELTDKERLEQQAMLAKHIAAANVVITTAAIPGRPSPKIITADMVRMMAAGSVIVDIAGEGGGNCALTQPGQTVEAQGVIIHAPLNIPSQLAVNASQLYSRNVFNLLALMLDNSELRLDLEDEVLAGCVLTHAGEIKHAPTRDLISQ